MATYMLSRSMQTSNDHQEINAFALTMEASSLCKDRKFKLHRLRFGMTLLLTFNFCSGSQETLAPLVPYAKSAKNFQVF